MLPSVKIDNSMECCDFVWLAAEACGPADPTCGADSKVTLIYTNYEDHRCVSHAAYDLSESFCKYLNIERISVSREAFKSLRAFFEAYLITKLSTPAT